MPRTASPALLKAMSPTPELQAVIGPGDRPRGQITKDLWSYIKKHNLQDATNRRQINADEKLKVIFGGRDSVSMFEMTKLVSAHIK